MKQEYPRCGTGRHSRDPYILLRGFALGHPFDDLELEPIELAIEALHPNSG